MGLSEKAKAHRRAQKKEYAARPEVSARRKIYTKMWATERYGSQNRYMRHRSYIARYGIDIHQYEKMEREQQHRCKLCGRSRDKKKHLAVDHDHSTGRIRGLLCTFCNLMVARVDADPNILQRLQEYCDADF